jgi:dihydropteroate synthase
VQTKVFRYRAGQWPLGDAAYVLGIINVTPDSFSDGADSNLSVDSTLDRAAQLVAEGADALDVGAESTRPGYRPVPWPEEWARLKDILAGLKERLPAVPISVDTQKPEVAERAVLAGVDILNDIWGFQHPAMWDLARTTDVGLIMMYNHDPHYPPGTFDVSEVERFFRAQMARAERDGIEAARILLDPGLGFAIRGDDNWRVLKAIGRWQQWGAGILIGHSRKSFLGTVSGREVPKERDGATALVSAMVVALGADVVRVHRVAPNKEAVQVGLAWRRA